MIDLLKLINAAVSYTANPERSLGNEHALLQRAARDLAAVGHLDMTAILEEQGLKHGIFTDEDEHQNFCDECQARREEGLGEPLALMPELEREVGDDPVRRAAAERRVRAGEHQSSIASDMGQARVQAASGLMPRGQSAPMPNNLVTSRILSGQRQGDEAPEDPEAKRNREELEAKQEAQRRADSERDLAAQRTAAQSSQSSSNRPLAALAAHEEEHNNDEDEKDEEEEQDKAPPPVVQTRRKAPSAPSAFDRT